MLACAFRLRTKLRLDRALVIRFLAGQTPSQIALLVDGDHVAPPAFRPMLNSLSEYGEVSVRRFYTTQHKAKLWHKNLEDHGMDTVIVPRWAGGKKDANDMVIALDAAELALSSGNGLSGIAVASDDLDFALLLARVAAWGLRPYVVIPSSGSAHAHARQVWEDAGAVIVPYLAKVKHSPVALNFDGRNFKVVSREAASLDTAVSGERYKEMVAFLKDLGYLPSDLDKLTLAGIIKFLFVNSLGPCAVLPRNLMECQFSELLEDMDCTVRGRLLSDPENLVVIDRIRKGADNDTMRSVRAGGPVVLTVGPALVQEVMRSLGFLDEVEEDTLDAIKAFAVVNGQLMEKRHNLKPGEILASPADAQMKVFHDLFSAQGMQQRWRIMPSDSAVRRKLWSCKLISCADAAQREDVLRAMQQFLSERGLGGTSDGSYRLAVLRCHAKIIGSNPESRST